MYNKEGYNFAHSLLVLPAGRGRTTEERVVTIYTYAEELLHFYATRTGINPWIEDFQNYFDIKRDNQVRSTLQGVNTKDRVASKLMGVEAAIVVAKENLANPVLRLHIGAFMLSRIEVLSDQRMLLTGETWTQPPSLEKLSQL